MKAQGLTRTAMAAEMETSRAQLNRGWTPGGVGREAGHAKPRAAGAGAGVEGGAGLGDLALEFLICCEWKNQRSILRCEAYLTAAHLPEPRLECWIGCHNRPFRCRSTNR